MTAPNAPYAGRLVVTTTTAASADRFLRGQLQFAARHGWDVHVVSSPAEPLEGLAEREGVSAHAVPMTREIAPHKDLLSLVRWIVLLAMLRPDVINAGTPKAGLLGMLAAWITRVPKRIYTVRGLRYETESGLKRAILRAMERATIRLSTDVVAVSASLRARLIEDRLSRRSIAVIGAGSSNGVETDLHKLSSALTRKDLGLPDDAFVVGYVGRIHPHKGADTFAAAMTSLRKTSPVRTHSLIIGDTEDAVAAGLLNDLAPNVTTTGKVPDVSAYYPLMDVLCLPTYREGFPNVVLEAAVASVPTVTTTATGAVDAVRPGITGEVVPPGDAHALHRTLLDLAARREHCTALGQKAHRWVVHEFQRERIWNGLLSIYEGRPTDDISFLGPTRPIHHCGGRI